jgi:hypothetical protein
MSAVSFMSKTTVAALCERRKAIKWLEIGGHRPPLQTNHWYCRVLIVPFSMVGTPRCGVRGQRSALSLPQNDHHQKTKAALPLPLCQFAGRIASYL